MSEDRVEAATVFKFTDAPNESRGDGNETLTNFYRRLSVWNFGGDIGGWVDETVARQRDYRELFEAIADSVEVTDYQEMRAWEHFGELPTETHQGNPTPLLVVAALILACREDGRRYHPLEARGDVPFDSLVDDLDYSRKQVAVVLHRVEELVGRT